jgi:Cache 3/Cache 2 fusion domain
MKALHALGVIALTTLSTFSTTALANDPKATITQLEERLNKIGAPKVEGTMAMGDKTVPVIFFGPRRINGNYDVVDEIKKASGATATVFVKDGEDFTRVSTNVLTPEGKRGVGTQLAKAKAYEAVKAGKEFCGDVDVLGTPYSACYRPIKDSSGGVIGVTYMGYKK